MAIITVTSTINYAYLMNKSKSDLAYMYLDLLELRVKDEAALAAERARADKLAAALEKSKQRIRELQDLLGWDSELPVEQRTVKPDWLAQEIDAALADWRKGE